MKAGVLIGFLLVAAVVAGLSIVGYTKFIAKPSDSTTTVQYTNPFTDKPASSFGTTPTPSFQNPFDQPSPTPYQNPFSTDESSQPYTNPFEQLR